MPFDAAIIQRDFTSIYDKALVLGGCSYLRTLTYGNGWSRIRLGALVAVTPNGTNNMSDASLTLGLCSGKDYPGSANLPANAFGASINGAYSTAAAKLMTYTANSGYPYFALATGTVYRRQGTNTINSTGFGIFFLPTAYTGTQKRRFPVVVDITRNLGGGGLATVIVYGVTTAAQAQLDYRPDDLQSALDQVGTPTVRNTALTASSTIATVPIGDEFGGLDTFELFWSNSAFPLEIYAVGAVVINPMINIPATGSITTLYADMGGAADNITQYSPGTQVTSFSSYGTGFSGAGTVLGSSYGTTVMGLPGTSGGVPYETFAQYAVGSVTSNVTINAGTGWSGNAFIY